MCEKNDFILEMIENIEFIIKRHNGIYNALNDIEGQMAVFMGVSQIGETLNKIEDNLLNDFLRETKKVLIIQETILCMITKALIW
ncbi:hypothetical protein [Caminibacter sp.]